MAKVVNGWSNDINCRGFEVMPIVSSLFIISTPFCLLVAQTGRDGVDSQCTGMCLTHRGEQTSARVSAMFEAENI